VGAAAYNNKQLDEINFNLNDDSQKNIEKNNSNYETNKNNDGDDDDDDDENSIQFKESTLVPEKTASKSNVLIQRDNETNQSKILELVL